MDMKILDMGERKIISRTYENMNITQNKDDCVVIPRGNDYELVTVDSINERTHIPRGVSPAKIGNFFGAVNLSDIAAMGGIPQYFLAAFNIPSSMELGFLDNLERGLDSILREFNVEYLGGDTKESDTMSFSGVCIGTASKEATLKRSNINKGQILCVTHNLGHKIAAFIAYSNGIRIRENAEKMLSIIPRVREGAIIAKCGGKFMMDLSDGLGSALNQMKTDYSFGFRVVKDQIPIHEDLYRIGKIVGIDPYEAIFRYGGDYELLFTIDNNNSEETASILRNKGVEFSMIGDVWENENIIFDGERWNPIAESGYEHFKPH